MAASHSFEEIKVLSHELADKVKELIREGNVNRIIIKDEKGHTFIEIPVTVAADTLASHVGADAARVSFIKIDVEGAETSITPQIAADFAHPELVVALEVRAQIEATLRPFQEAGFHVYDLHSNFPWLFERKVPAITQVAYSDLYDRDSVDILLSRQPLAV